MEEFAIATFCFGEIYYNQVNRLISEIDKCDLKPTLIVLTDNKNKILDKVFVKTFDIGDLNPEYKNYSNNYYDFDFSVKRYTLLSALNLGFTKIILTDADAVPNQPLFTKENILKGFKPNSILGQVTYNFNNEILTNSMLGRRFNHYETIYNKNFDKNLLDFMPEDCVQYIDIDLPKFYNFLRTWDDCISIKKRDGLLNTPAGNIDEMCFSALHNGIEVGNNSDRIINVLINKHDKWYIEGKTNNDVSEDQKILTTEKKKKIVTSIYDLNYIDERGSAIYKGITLLTQTIRNIIFDGYDYVIYTDNSTRKKHNLDLMFNKTNVEIKEVELNSDFYLNEINPVRLQMNEKGEIWDRIFCVHNYIEVIYNKIQFMLDESENFDGELVWLDAGLLGTSCGNGWRDYMNEICHTKNFVDKLFEKISKHKFVSLKGNSILINYELRDRINRLYGVNPYIIPGALFGGESLKVLEYLKNYKDLIRKILNTGEYISEQEILYLLLHDKDMMFFEFNDWDDFQKGLLKIMDLYDENNYDKDSVKPSEIKINESQKPIVTNIETTKFEFDYPITNKTIVETLLSLTNSELDKIDLSHNDDVLSKMSTFATLFKLDSGREHYRLLSYIGYLFNKEILIDIGTNNGCSALALAQNESNSVISYDIIKFEETKLINKENIEFKIENILNNLSVINRTRFIFLDANQDGVFEVTLVNKLIEKGYKGILIIDDINLNSEMKDFWKNINLEKHDLTKLGHDTGTGLIIFE
jgi:predicted O-methyltransferase YrrM